MRNNCIIILIFLLVCTGCQKTPEEPIVVGKDQQQMIEKAQGETVYAADAPAGVDWAARLGAPKRYEAKLTSAGGHLVVDVDATVRLPEVELPVVRVSPYLFTDEDVHRYARALLGEELKCLDPWNENNRTKAMWEKEIMALKNDLDHWEEYGSIIWDSYDSKADFERALQEKMARAANAPERPETAAPTWTWETPNVWTKDGKQETSDRYMTLLVLNEDNSESLLSIDRASEWGRCGLRYLRDADSSLHFDLFSGVWPNELSLTREGAQQAAEQKLKDMGLDHLQCAYGASLRVYRGGVIVEGNPYGAYWAFVFTPAVNGAPMGFTAQTAVEPSEFNREWRYEQCRVLVDEAGVALLEYDAPCAVERVEVEAATLLPYSKIQEIFEKMVLIVNNNADVNGSAQRYTVTEVRLSLVSLPEQNGDGGLLVPCWDFLGYPPETGGYPPLWRTLGLQPLGAYCHLTVNAIDGSIIQRQ